MPPPSPRLTPGAGLTSINEGQSSSNMSMRTPSSARHTGLYAPSRPSLTPTLTMRENGRYGGTSSGQTAAVAAVAHTGTASAAPSASRPATSNGPPRSVKGNRCGLWPADQCTGPVCVDEPIRNIASNQTWSQVFTCGLCTHMLLQARHKHLTDTVCEQRVRQAASLLLPTQTRNCCGCHPCQQLARAQQQAQHTCALICKCWLCDRQDRWGVWSLSCHCSLESTHSSSNALCSCSPCASISRRQSTLRCLHTGQLWGLEEVI
jgi:hypothetical protein